MVHVFTEKYLANFQAPEKRVLLTDARTSGLQLWIQPTGQKSLAWSRRIKGRLYFRNFGIWPDEVSVSQARDEADKLNSKVLAWRLAGYPSAENPLKEKEDPARSEVPLFSELLESYILRRIRTDSRNPERAEYDVRLYAKTHLSGLLEKRLDQLDVQDFAKIKEQCGQRRVAANRAIQLCRRVLRWSGKRVDGKLNFWAVPNHAAEVSLHKERKRKRFLQPDELLRFNKELAKEQNRDLRHFLSLALSTGARRSAVLGMRWENVSFERKVWHVPYTENKSGDSYEVNLRPASLSVLEERKQLAEKNEIFVFPGTGKAAHVMDLKKSWGEFRKRAKIPDITIHDLRRSHGSYLAVSGASLQIIGSALGHRSTASTQIYSQLLSQAVREAQDKSERKMRLLMASAAKREQKSKRSKAKPSPGLKRRFSATRHLGRAV
jgi:integrase